MIGSPHSFLNAMVVTIAIDPFVTADLIAAVRNEAYVVDSAHSEEYVSFSRRPSFGPQIHAAEACIAFVNFDTFPEAAIESTHYLAETYAGKLAVVAVASNPSPTTILAAMRAGCSEIISDPKQPLWINTVVERLQKISGVSSLRKQPARIVGLLGAKGGVGTTTAAVNLAIHLSARHGKHTLLIDQHLSLGHVCVYLGLDGSNSQFHDVVRNLPRMDSELLQRTVAKHSTGLEVLSSPDRRRGLPNQEHDSLLLDAHAVSRTLEFLQQEYDYIIMDCDRTHYTSVSPILRACHYLYLVGTPEVAALRDLSRFVDDLSINPEDADKLRVVINRLPSPCAVPPDQIERALKLPVSVVIPNDYPLMIRAANLGEPLPHNSSDGIPAAFSKWADALAGAPKPASAAKKDRRGLSLLRQVLTTH
jgi:pilus assembly protein CpaE